MNIHSLMVQTITGRLINQCGDTNMLGAQCHAKKTAHNSPKQNNLA